MRSMFGGAPAAPTPQRSFFQTLRSSINGDEDVSTAELKASASVEMSNVWGAVSSGAKKTFADVKTKLAPVAASAGIKIPEPAPDQENLIGGGMVGELSEEMNSMCPELTYRQRIVGALSCAGIGLLLNIFAVLALLAGKKHIADYAVFYTLGNITSICGSGFLVGPMRQLKVMFDPVRRVACIIYFTTLVGTVFIAIFHPDVLLIFLMLGVQYGALIWYGASFIPFGRTCISKACRAAWVSTKSAMGLTEP